MNPLKFLHFFSFFPSLFSCLLDLSYFFGFFWKEMMPPTIPCTEFSMCVPFVYKITTHTFVFHKRVSEVFVQTFMHLLVLPVSKGICLQGSRPVWAVAWAGGTEQTNRPTRGLRLWALRKVVNHLTWSLEFPTPKDDSGTFVSSLGAVVVKCPLGPA